jgi:hypothetical protein
MRMKKMFRIFITGGGGGKEQTNCLLGEIYVGSGVMT